MRHVLHHVIAPKHCTYHSMLLLALLRLLAFLGLLGLLGLLCFLGLLCLLGPLCVLCALRLLSLLGLLGQADVDASMHCAGRQNACTAWGFGMLLELSLPSTVTRNRLASQFPIDGRRLVRFSFLGVFQCKMHASAHQSFCV